MPEPAEIDYRQFSKKPRILVVDDDIHIVGLLRSNLEAEGYSVLWATDGVMAKLIAWEGRPDLIITDIMMPGLDGLSMVDAIFTRPGVKKTPVIFVSSKAAEDFHPQQDDLPVRFALIKKPIHLAEFNLLVRELLTSASA